MAGLHKPPGSLPFFGHALILLKSCPWDTLMGWMRGNGNQPYALDFMMQVCDDV